METKYYDPGNGQFVLIDGQIVERDALRIAEKIKDYDEDLELICLDPDSAVSITDAPFLVIKRLPNGSYTRILEAWALDDRLIERLYLADTQRGESPLDRLVKMEQERKAKEKAAQIEASGDKKEMAVAALANPKSSFTFKDSKGDLIKINDFGPKTVNNNRKSI